MPAALQDSYDALPYPSLPLPQTHPDVLATAATLLGMTPAPIDRCRVLELGCASGGNLMPMAASFPHSRFLGIDLSPRQVAEGQALIGELGLTNLELRAADLMTIDDGGPDSDIGEFDYIICHGVYSWVPPNVQEKILAVCQKHLAPQGVAYISYNTYPGFYRRQPIREMMRYHVSHFEKDGQTVPPMQAIGQAHALLDLVAQGVPDQNSVWARILQTEIEKLRKAPDSYLYHEHLEAENRPCYFHEFIAAASQHGMQYLTEAERLGTIEELPAVVRQALAPLSGDIIRFEQYLDFIANRTLRNTLLCRSEVKLDRDPKPERLRPLYAVSVAWPTEDAVDVRSDQGVCFASRLGRVTVPNPDFKSVLMALCERHPQALSFDELRAHAQESLGGEIAEEALSDILAHGYQAGLIGLRVHAPGCVTEISNRPTASPLARMQARKQRTVASLVHQMVELNPLERLLIVMLDGQTEIEAMLQPLLNAALNGMLVISRGQTTERDPAALREILSSQIRPTLAKLARSALIVC